MSYQEGKDIMEEPENEILLLERAEPLGSIDSDQVHNADKPMDENERKENALKGLHAIKVQGQIFDKMPEDLYIPPHALEVFLDAFSGPLDLLLYLIRKQNLDILNIPIAQITAQYVAYVELMTDLKLELAADYLVMAAVLAEIKSRMLLPRQDTDDEEELDPRAELVRRLQEYERFKQAANILASMPQVGRDVFLIEEQNLPEVKQKLAEPKVSLQDLVSAFVDVLKRSDLLATHKIQQDTLSVRERMSQILALVNEHPSVLFEDCFDANEGRMGVVVTFLAILELTKITLLDIVQTESFGPIHLKAIAYESIEEPHIEYH